MRSYQLGLIGWPVAHSLSPWIQQKALQDCGLEGEYNLYAIDPQHFDERFSPILQKLRNGELNGINVTVPHKQRVLAYLDRLTNAARTAGAVNTIFLEGGDLVGDNTDITGFWMDLERLGWVKQFDISAHSQGSTPGNRAIVLGAGGAACAVALALGQHGWQVGLAARRKMQADQTISDLNQALAASIVTPLSLNEELLGIFGDPVALIINATSAGMPPQIDQDPWPEQLPFPMGICVYDLVYNPLKTRFLLRAREQGLQTANGLGMLVGQAVLAFQRWTKQTPSFDGILKDLLQHISLERPSNFLKSENQNPI
jgi:shikimate dehydrogenase